MRLSVSIVLYHNGKELKEAIRSVLNCPFDLKLYIVDNSETDQLRPAFSDSRLEYIFNGRNMGFGAAHNIAIRRAEKEHSNYHLIMNPDVSFETVALDQMLEYMEQHHDVGALMPKVIYPDGQLQRLGKLLPSPVNLFARRFFNQIKKAQQLNYRYELGAYKYDRVLNVPCLSGCFMLVRTSVINAVGHFDERYFMYLEDYDLSRRIHQEYKTVIFPAVSITHLFTKGSYKNANLLKVHLQSAFRYFNKWGWYSDKERRLVNKQALEDIRNLG